MDTIKTNWEPTKNMKEYLSATELADFESDIVRETAKALLVGVQTQNEAAMKIYQFVQKMEYCLIPLETKASQVLKMNKSECAAKTTLLVALLRAVNISARYHFVSIKKELLNGLFHPLVYYFMAPVVPGHGFCEVYLDGNWIAIEVLWDTELFMVIKENKLNCLDFTCGQLEWDGKRDIALNKKWIAEDMGTFASADDLLKGNPMQLNFISKLFLPFGFYISNLHIEKMRKHYRKYKGVK